MSTEDCPTPLPTDPTWFKKFNAAVGDPDPKVQATLAKKMQLAYRCGVGKLIWAMTTTCPDLAFASVKLSQANAAPNEHHYHGVKHALKYLYSTRDDGIYFWQTAPQLELKEGPLPRINSNDLIYLLMTVHNMMHLHYMRLRTLTGRLASRPDDRLVGLLFVLLMALLHTNQISTYSCQIVN